MNQQPSIHALSQQDFLLLGINDVAYVLTQQRDEREVFVIHSADGAEVVALADREIAFATVRQNGLEPLSVH